MDANQEADESVLILAAWGATLGDKSVQRRRLTTL
jgi:hypothetical protein